MNFIEQLEQLRRERAKQIRPNSYATGYFENSYIVKPPRSAAQMEKLITEFIKLSGYHCQKVSTMGVKRGNTWTKGTATKGASDLLAIVDGKAYAFEVKFSKGDRQRDDQKGYEDSVKRAGGEYYIIRTLDQFLEIFKTIIKQ
jgi:hypothetical protein